MITQNVIMTVLIGIVLTGVVPLIGGIVLLATHKIKASSFWAGVLAYVIATIAYSIVGGIISMSVMMSSGNMMMTEADFPPVLTAVLSAVLCVFIVLAMGICIGACMKKTRTFNGAVSCGLGFGAGYLITTAISLVSIYAVFAQINSGAFDKQYASLIEMGAMDKEMVKSMKEVYTGFTVLDGFSQVLAAAGFAMLCVAAAVFIMRGACVKKTFAGIGISALIFAAIGGVSALITNAVAGTVIVVAVGVAALIFALRMKEQIAVPEQPAAPADSFIQSIENAKSENTETSDN